LLLLPHIQTRSSSVQDPLSLVTLNFQGETERTKAPSKNQEEKKHWDEVKARSKP